MPDHSAYSEMANWGDVRMLHDAKGLVGALTAISDEGAGSIPLVFLVVRSHKAGMDVRDFRPDRQPEDKYKFAMTAEVAEMVAQELLRAVRRAQ